MMLIVIPTYKRNECLHWVLQSVAQSCVDEIPEKIRVLVVNNYPPAANEIKDIVEGFKKYTKFSWDILYREKTLIPIENWYSAIFDNALPNEVVFINSDDDLLLPLSLKSRYFEILKNKAEILLGMLGPNIFFSEGGNKIFCEAKPIIENIYQVKRVNYSNILEYAPQHLSNHCYLNTIELRNAYDLAFSWCEELTWLDRHNRTIFLPLYLPLALLLLGGVVIGLNLQTIWRGRDIDEIKISSFGVNGWNHGFIHGVVLIVLNNDQLKNIHELNSIRSESRDQYSKWFLTYLVDSRLELKKVLMTQRRANISWATIFSLNLLYGINLLFKHYFRLRGRRLIKLSKYKSIKTVDFMKSILQLNR